ERSAPVIPDLRWRYEPVTGTAPARGPRSAPAPPPGRAGPHARAGRRPGGHLHSVPVGGGAGTQGCVLGDDRRDRWCRGTGAARGPRPVVADDRAATGRLPVRVTSVCLVGVLAVVRASTDAARG